MTPGIHLLHKPVGPTSFSLVQACIEETRARQTHAKPRICHGGTLDPFASGLLLMLAGPATKLFDHLHSIPKIYETTVRWGVETDTGDLHGQTIFTGDPSSLSTQQLDDALATFTGWQEQVPPPTSAKRIGGERAYVKAHRGETVVMPPSRVYLHEAQWLSHDLPRESRVRLVVRGGYYVRAFARDLGRLVACGAHLTSLQRTAIGPWSDPGPAATLEAHPEVHGRELLPWAQTRALTDQETGDLRSGQTIITGKVLPPDWPLPEAFPDPAAPIRGLHLGRLLFLLKPHEARLQVVTAFGAGI